MKSLIICDTYSEKLLGTTFSSFYGDKKANLLIVKDEDSFQKLDLEKVKPKHIWILVELGWPENDLYGGYDVALKLIDSDYAKQTPLQITFFSFLSREYLFNNVLGFLNIFPKAFVHNRLRQPVLQTTHFSAQKWKYTRKYGFTKSGIIDKLHHDFDDLLKFDKKNDDPERIQEFLIKLSNISDLLTPEINEMVQSINPANYHGHRLKLNSKLTSLIQDLNKYREVTTPKKTAWKPHVLFVEDNKLFAETLMKELSALFNINHYNNGEEALEHLKKNGPLYDGLICDLELLDPKGYDQNIQGIDIVHYVQRFLPHIEINIITNIPKSGIKDILDNFLSKDIRYKSTFKKYPESEWKEYAAHLLSQLKNRARTKYLTGPNTSIWSNVSNQNKNGGGLKTYYYNLKINYTDKFETLWKEIDYTFEEVMNRHEKIPTSFGRTKDRTELSSSVNSKTSNLLKNIILHRRFWLKMLYDKSGYASYNVNPKDVVFFDKVFAFFQKTTAKSDKRHSSYASVLGFSIFKEGTEKYKFVFNTLFPEEIQWLKTTVGIQTLDFSNEFSYLANHTFVNILHVIKQGNPQAFQVGKYPDPFVPKNMKDVEKLVLLLEEENSKRRIYRDREEVVNIIYDLKYNATEEFNKLYSKIHDQTEHTHD